MKYALALLLPAYSFCQDCHGIEKKVDKFDGHITYDLYSDEILKLVDFVKIENPGQDTTIFVYLTAYGLAPSYAEKGVTILLMDGSKISKPEAKVNCSFTGGQYNQYKFAALVALSESDLAKLKKSFITDFRLYIHDTTLRKKQMERAMEKLYCIIDAR